MSRVRPFQLPQHRRQVQVELVWSAVIAFLGWVSILHLGPNTPIYPFFAFDDPNDPYTFRLTLSASAVIFAAELFAGYLARSACWLAYEIDVTNLGLDQFREHVSLLDRRVQAPLRDSTDIRPNVAAGACHRLHLHGVSRLVRYALVRLHTCALAAS